MIIARHTFPTYKAFNLFSESLAAFVDYTILYDDSFDESSSYTPDFKPLHSSQEFLSFWTALLFKIFLFSLF
jgi:hypothetical protein